jgi:hypothetical protein
LTPAFLRASLTRPHLGTYISYTFFPMKPTTNVFEGATGCKRAERGSKKPGFVLVFCYCLPILQTPPPTHPPPFISAHSLGKKAISIRQPARMKMGLIRPLRLRKVGRVLCCMKKPIVSLRPPSTTQKRSCSWSKIFLNGLCPFSFERKAAVMAFADLMRAPSILHSEFIPPSLHHMLLSRHDGRIAHTLLLSLPE